jgi:hypothetical protein
LRFSLGLAASVVSVGTTCADQLGLRFDEELGPYGSTCLAYGVCGARPSRSGSKEMNVQHGPGDD